MGSDSVIFYECMQKVYDVVCATMKTSTYISVKAPDFDQMLKFSRLMYRIERMPVYAQSLTHPLPDTACRTVDHASILMGYDFHLTPDGPRLIEVNNNASGLWHKQNRWLPQPDHSALQGDMDTRFLSMFSDQWSTIAIMDEDVTNQYMYQEMLAYAALLERHGRQAFVVSPEDIEQGEDGRLYTAQTPLDAIYNRHTDFYLESTPLAHIRQAYMNGHIALTPHPRSYALLGDKRRMVDWWHTGLLEKILPESDIALIRSVVPEIHRMAAQDAEKLWSNRAAWVFKPADRHGGKGVMLGKNMSRRRFASFYPQGTVVQRFIPPEKVVIHDVTFKSDVRLYMHGETLIAMAGRIWQGQVTNFRAEGSGFVPLSIEHS